MISFRKLRMTLTLVPVCLLGPAAARAGGPVSPSTEVHREVSGGQPKSGAPGGTLSDAGIAPGPSVTLQAASDGTAPKRGVPGGTLHGAIEAGARPVAPTTATGQALRQDAGRGPAKRRVAGGTIGEAAPVAGGARVYRLGDGVSAVKSGVPGGSLPALSSDGASSSSAAQPAQGGAPRP